MATQFDPIAKDESLNTTEATPRNIADVLAEGLKGIEDALPPSYTEGDGIDISNNEISVDTTFTEASTRANIASGESFATILGKIKKFFTDLKTVAFTGAASDASFSNSGTDLSSTDVQNAIVEVNTKVNADKALKVTIPSFSTLPVTVSNASITADMEVTHFVLGSNVWIDATCTTASGSLTISGSVGGSTTLTLYLEVPRA